MKTYKSTPPPEKYDYEPQGINWIALIIWILFIILVALSGILTWWTVWGRYLLM